MRECSQSRHREQAMSRCHGRDASRMDSIDEDAFLPDSGGGHSDRKSAAAGSLSSSQQHQSPHHHSLQHQVHPATQFPFAAQTGPVSHGIATYNPRTAAVHPSQHQLHHPAVHHQPQSLSSRRSSQSSSPATPRESVRSPLVIGIPGAAAGASGLLRQATCAQPAPGWLQGCQASPIMQAFATSAPAPQPPQPPPLQMLPSLPPPGFRLDPKKHYSSLGRCGLRVSCLGLGTWVTFAGQVPDSVAEDILTLAYACGINFFDTAEVYAAGRAELLLGRLLRKAGWRRSSYTVSTKIFWGGKAETERGLSRKHIVEGLQASLQRLQLDYVDIVFANRPDPHTPMEEIVRAFSFCIDRGWAFYWGTSRWSPMEIMEAHSVARQFNLIPPVAEQVEYHMFQREKLELQMPELFSKLGLGAVVWSPLACGILSGKYDDGVPVYMYSRASLKGYSWLRDKILSEDGRQQQAKLKELAEVAARLDCTLAQLAIAWCVRSGHASCVLLGASSAEQLYENICALPVVPKLTAALMAEIDRILDNKPVAPSKSGQQPGASAVAQSSATTPRR